LLTALFLPADIIRLDSYTHETCFRCPRGGREVAKEVGAIYSAQRTPPGKMMTNNVNGNLSENTMRSTISRPSGLNLPSNHIFLLCGRPSKNGGQPADHGSDINAIILDYLTMEGYPKAAANFSKEANLQPQQEDSSIRLRQQIQNYIHVGQIQNAINELNELDPDVSCPPANPPSPLRHD